MKKLAGMFLLALVGTVGQASARPATTNVVLDVQVSTNALPGATVAGKVLYLGSSHSATGSTNAQGKVRFSYNITPSTPIAPAQFSVLGQGTDGMNILTGGTNGNFSIILGTPSIHVPVFLPLQ